MSTYLQKLKANPPRVQAAQRLNYVMFNPALCQGIAQCYYNVWGDTFPATFMYEPELIKEYYTEKGQIGAFAVTQFNEVVGMFCAYPFHASEKVYELGGLMVIPEYRGTIDLKRLITMVRRELSGLNLDMSIGQIVAHHKGAQKVFYNEITTNVSGIELSAFSYQKNHELLRTAYVDTVTIHNTEARQIFVPKEYREVVQRNVSQLKLNRVVHQDSSTLIKNIETRLKSFSYEKVLKIEIESIGEGFLGAIKEQIEMKKSQIIQIAVPLESEGNNMVIQHLNKEGYFFSSYIPFFNGCDCIILQKIEGQDPFENINLFSDDARKMLDFIKLDYQRVIDLKD